MTVVDVHHHALPPVYVEHLSKAGIEALPGYGFPPWEPEASLEMMEANGIGRAVLSVSAPGLHVGNRAETTRLARMCNEYLAELVATEPRFQAFGCLPLPYVDAAVEEAAWVLDEQRFAGVVVYTNNAGMYPGDERLAPLLRQLSDLGAVAFVHPVQPCGQEQAPLPIRPSILEFVFESSRAAASLIAGRCTTRYPGIRWVLTHGGGTVPYLAERLEHMHRDPALKSRASLDVSGDLASFYYDLASCTRPHALACLGAVSHPSRLVFGSDFPFETSASASAALAELRTNPTIETSLAGVWAANAEVLLGPGARGAPGPGEAPGTATIDRRHPRHPPSDGERSVRPKG